MIRGILVLVGCLELSNVFYSRIESLEVLFVVVQIDWILRGVLVVTSALS